MTKFMQEILFLPANECVSSIHCRLNGTTFLCPHTLFDPFLFDTKFEMDDFRKLDAVKYEWLRFRNHTAIF